MVHVRAAARCAAAVLVVFASVAGVVRAADRDDALPPSAVKAAFLFNFAKFIDWPGALGSAGPLVLCVVEDAAVAESLDSLARGRLLQQRPVHVRKLRGDADVRGCHLAYVAGLDDRTSTELAAGLKHAPVFSISDYRGFTSHGGIAHFFLEDKRMRFAINPGAAQRAKLRIHSQVLSLAKIVTDGHAY